MMYRLVCYRLLTFFILLITCIPVLAQDDSSKTTLLADTLYLIDNKKSSKEEVDKLDKSIIKSVDVWNGEHALQKFGDRGKNGVVAITTKTAVAQLDDYDVVFTKAEVAAAFPGGIDGWRRYLEQNLRYPKAAQKRGTQGVVRIQMTVKKDGSLTNVAVVNDPGDGLGDEGKRVVVKGPKWIPANQNGKAVNYRFVQTITFQLQ